MPPSFAHLRANPRAAYVHIPFCISKCHYCDFNSYPGMEACFGDYTQALISEIERAPVDSRGEDTLLDSVFFGGGTPSILPAAMLADVLGAVESRLGVGPYAEVTLEANPGTVDESKFARLSDAGFNRVSLGVQSFDDELLSRIGRAHTTGEAVEAYWAARRVGFANVGIDLIFALPGQSLENWRQTLDKAIELQPEHVSLYELSIEEGTRFAQMCAEGTLQPADEDLRLEMYEMAIASLTMHGYEHYEVSNFAKPGFRCRHNQVYWRNEPYYGFGAGATSYIRGVRARRIAGVRDYIEAIGSSANAIEFSEQLTGRSRLSETVILGLRMLEGVDLHKFSTECGTDVLAEFGPEIDRLRERGLVEIADGRLKVTHKGLLLLNDVSLALTPA